MFSVLIIVLSPLHSVCTQRSETGWPVRPSPLLSGGRSVPTLMGVPDASSSLKRWRCAAAMQLSSLLVHRPLDHHTRGNDGDHSHQRLRLPGEGVMLWLAS